MRRTSLGPAYRRLFGASVVSNLGDGVATVAQPWLAAAVTRNPLLVAAVAAASRVPWLVVSLPAGVLTDRRDRRRLIVSMDVLRGVVAGLVMLAVVVDGIGPESAAGADATRWPLYLVLVLAALVLGSAEVVRDNAAQTILPSIVAATDLERANGRLWSAESVANSFVGPPLGALLVGVSFAVPFGVDAASFLIAAASVAGIASLRTDDRVVSATRRAPWKTELREGVAWLWRHRLLRSMAIALGIMNAASALTGAVFVLFAQEVLHTSAAQFAVIGMAGAFGGVAGGLVASRLSRRFGSGTCLAVAMLGFVVVDVLMAVTTSWPVAAALFALTSVLGLVWNVITVSFRQTVIPDALLGRVNSVYRFFAWGMMPLGAVLGGALVAVVAPLLGREAALRSVWWLSATVHLCLWLIMWPRLSTDRIEAARRVTPVSADS